jgi:hypothetical protein
MQSPRKVPDPYLTLSCHGFDFGSPTLIFNGKCELQECFGKEHEFCQRCYFRPQLTGWTCSVEKKRTSGLDCRGY